MKITSINVFQPGDVQVKIKNTQNAQNVRMILENLAKQPASVKELVIAGDDIAKFERYSLQKNLQKAGAHVLVRSGTHSKTNKPVLILQRLTDAEWKEYIKP